MRKPVIQLGPAIDRNSAATRTADRFDKFHSLACGQILSSYSFSADRILTKPACPRFTAPAGPLTSKADVASSAFCGSTTFDSCQTIFGCSERLTSYHFIQE
jgi:hypothetical protein